MNHKESSSSQTKLFSPAQIGPVTLRNRTIRSAAFEGMGKNNAPTPELRDYHFSVSEGGVGMTTLAYAGVCQSALSFKTQLWLRPEIIKPLREITDGIHQRGAKASIQIGHCGNMTHRSTAGGTPVGASTGFNLYSPTFVRGLKKDEIIKIAKYFGDAVNTARDAGFDCVELHAGHGYLLSQFLSPYTNKRCDEFGGSLQNRMKFLNMALEEVLKAAGNDMGVIVKTNMHDGFKSGLQTDDCLLVAKEIERAGAHAIVLSGGFVSRAPMFVMRGEMPIHTMTHYMPQLWLKYGVRAVGKYMIKKEPFKPLYFLDMSRKFRKELSLPLIYVGGITTGEDLLKITEDEGFEFAQLGRVLINEPDFVNRVKTDLDHVSECDHANFCVARIYASSMQCHHHCKNLTPGMQREINRITKQ